MNTSMRPVPRSMLFTPATKASYFDKAAQVGAAAVILDLEDSVPTAAKGMVVDRRQGRLQHDRAEHVGAVDHRGTQHRDQCGGAGDEVQVHVVTPLNW